MTPSAHFPICLAQHDDGPAMQALIADILRNYGLQPDLIGVDADVLDVDKYYRASGGEFFCVKLPQLIATAGFVGISDDVAELRKMYIHPTQRGKGLGRQLLQLCEQTALARGYTIMQLETASVLQEAIALYERNGYSRSCAAPHVSRCDRIYQKTL